MMATIVESEMNEQQACAMRNPPLRARGETVYPTESQCVSAQVSFEQRTAWIEQGDEGDDGNVGTFAINKKLEAQKAVCDLLEEEHKARTKHARMTMDDDVDGEVDVISIENARLEQAKVKLSRDEWNNSQDCVDWAEDADDFVGDVADFSDCVNHQSSKPADNTVLTFTLDLKNPIVQFFVFIAVLFWIFFQKRRTVTIPADTEDDKIRTAADMVDFNAPITGFNIQFVNTSTVSADEVDDFSADFDPADFTAGSSSGFEFVQC